MGVRGFDYEWLASDASGHVGFFSTAGGGYVPEVCLEDADAYDAAVEAILSMEPSTHHAPQVERIDTWQRMAQRGMFAYDADYFGGPYRIVATPEHPIRLDALPATAASVARRLTLSHLRFSELSEVAAELLARR